MHEDLKVTGTMNYTALSARYKYQIFYVLLFLSVALCVSFATVRNTTSDPRGTFLVTESILTHHTIKLDHYGANTLHNYGYVIQKKSDHYYYYFPIGTSLISLPLVAGAKLFHLNMLQVESKLQIVAALFSAWLTLFFLIKLARLFLSPLHALLISSVFWFGSSLASTASTALWSHNFATLFALMAIYLAVNAALKARFTTYPLIALLLFTAYLCRPTMAILSPCLILFIYNYHKQAAIRISILLCLLLSCFMLFSQHEFQQILPDYYLPQRLSGAHVKEALYGNLLSPARGLLIYSPFIAVAWLCFDASKPFVLKKSWWLIGLGWPVMHLIFISRFPHWWAGFSYGARFMTDVLPGLFLLTLRTWPTNFHQKKPAIIMLFFASFFGVYANAYQGLFNVYSAEWNAGPNVDQYPQYLFDWHYPPFLHNKHRHEKRLIQHRNRIEKS